MTRNEEFRQEQRKICGREESVRTIVLTVWERIKEDIEDIIMDQLEHHIAIISEENFEDKPTASRPSFK